MKKLSWRTKNRLLVLAFAVLLFIVALTPLAPEAEIMTRLMVDVIGIDVGEDGVTVTAETTAAGSHEVVTGKGRLLSEAFYDIDDTYGRHLELGHCGLVVLGSNLSKTDMMSIFRTILSDAEINAGCSVIAAEGTAYDFVQESVLLTKSTNDGASGYATYADGELAVTVPSVLEFMQSLVSKSGAGVLPVVGLKQKQEEKGGGDTQSQNSGKGQNSSQSEGDGEETEIVPPKTFRVVGREVYVLSEEDSRGLIWMQKRAGSGMMESACKFGDRLFTVRAVIEEKESGVRAAFEEKPVVTLSVDVRLKFLDRYTVLSEVEAGGDLTGLIRIISDAFTETIKADVGRTVEVSRRDDILGFRTMLYRADARRFKEWSGDMNEVEVRYDVRTTIV